MSMIVTDQLSSRINFETRKGYPINNTQSLIISAFQTKSFPNMERQYARAKQRSGPSGYFNCHGLVFGARRAEITEASEIMKILCDDEYREVQRVDVLAGDVILYYSEGDIEHSGIVVERPEPLLYVPLVVSKWGAWCEVVHYANDCPYDFSDVKYFRIFQ